MKKVLCVKFSPTSKKVYRFLIDKRFDSKALDFMIMSDDMCYTFYDVVRHQFSHAYIVAVKEVEDQVKATKELQFIVTGQSLKYDMRKFHFALISWPTMMADVTIRDNSKDVYNQVRLMFHLRRHKLYRSHYTQQDYEDLIAASVMKESEAK